MQKYFLFILLLIFSSSSFAMETDTTTKSVAIIKHHSKAEWAETKFVQCNQFLNPEVTRHNPQRVYSEYLDLKELPPIAFVDSDMFDIGLSMSLTTQKNNIQSMRMQKLAPGRTEELYKSLAKLHEVYEKSASLNYYECEEGEEEQASLDRVQNLSKELERLDLQIAMLNHIQSEAKNNSALTSLPEVANYTQESYDDTYFYRSYPCKIYLKFIYQDCLVDKDGTLVSADFLDKELARKIKAWQDLAGKIQLSMPKLLPNTLEFKFLSLRPMVKSFLMEKVLPLAQIRNAKEEQANEEDEYADFSNNPLVQAIQKASEKNDLAIVLSMINQGYHESELEESEITIGTLCSLLKTENELLTTSVKALRVKADKFDSLKEDNENKSKKIKALEEKNEKIQKQLTKKNEPAMPESNNTAKQEPKPEESVKPLSKPSTFFGSIFSFYGLLNSVSSIGLVLLYQNLKSSQFSFSDWIGSLIH